MKFLHACNIALVLIILLLSDYQAKILNNSLRKKFERSKANSPEAKVCDAAFGFTGVSLYSLKNSIAEFLKKQIKEIGLVEKVHKYFQDNVKNEKLKKAEEFVHPYVETVLNAVVDLAGKGAYEGLTTVFNGAIGDFAGKDFKTDESLKSLCGAIEYASESKVGVLAFKIGQLPCTTTGTASIEICLTFNQCGLVTLSFNGGLLSCIATATGYGAAASSAVNALGKMALGFSFRREITKNFDLVYYDKSKSSLQKKEGKDAFVLRGHLFLTIDFNLTDAIFGDIKFGTKKAGDILKIGGHAKLLITFGDTVDKIENAFKQLTEMKVEGIGKKLEEAKKIGKELLLGLVRTGAGFGLNGEVELKLNLQELTKVLPNISLLKAVVNVVSLLPGSESGIPGGIYLYTQLDFNLFQEVFGNIVNKVIFPLAKVIKPELKELKDIDLKTGINVSIIIGELATGISVSTSQGLLQFNCHLKYENYNLTCKFDTWGSVKSFFVKAVDAIFESDFVKYSIKGLNGIINGIKTKLGIKRRTVFIELPKN